VERQLNWYGENRGRGLREGSTYVVPRLLGEKRGTQGEEEDRKSPFNKNSTGGVNDLENIRVKKGSGS